MTTVFLTGFMGAGKTTIGKALANELNLSLFDTDELIEKTLNKTINDIFEEEGEDQFRHYEKKILEKVSGQPLLVTTGGGIVTRSDNRRTMRKDGVIIYLHSNPETILERLETDTSRPLLKKDKEKQILTLFEDRLPFYLEADYVVSTIGKSVDTIVTEIVGLLSREARFWTK